MVVFLLTFDVVQSGVKLSSRSAAQGMVQENARQVVETIVREVKGAGEDCTGWEVGVNPDPVDQFYDQEVGRISFSRCVGYDSGLELMEWGPVVTYEFEPAIGDEPGKIVRIENGTRVAVCNNVTTFTVTYDSGSSVLAVSATLQVEDPESPGNMIGASYTGNAKLMN
jgi:hypothetical protein